jgi:hypothetical protein
MFAVALYVIYVQLDELEIRNKDKNKYNHNTDSHD